MDPAARAVLASLIGGERIAALGTLREGAPLVSMVAFLAEHERSGFLVRVSRLAWHTQDMLKDPRTSLCITQRDDGREDPQTLARLSIRAEAMQLEDAGEDYQRLKAAWLARHPASAISFELADFRFWRLAPRDARLVAGFGRTYNLPAGDLRA